MHRADSLMLCLWSAIEILSIGGIVLPSVNTRGQALAGSAGFLVPGLLASLVVAGLPGAASMIPLEEPLRGPARVDVGFAGRVSASARP